LLGFNSRMAEHFTAIGFEDAGQDLLRNSVRLYNAVKPMGKYKLKNVSEEVDVFKLLPRFGSQAEP